jgi:hypothetical protein
MVYRYALSPQLTKQAADCPVSCCFDFVVSWKPEAGTPQPIAGAKKVTADACPPSLSLA